MSPLITSQKQTTTPRREGGGRGPVNNRWPKKRRYQNSKIVFIRTYSSVAAGRKRSTQQDSPAKKKVLETFGASACVASLVALIHINGIQNQFSTALIMVVLL
jgi:hypothetical protein